MGRQDVAWGVSPRTARRRDSSPPQSPGGATETLRSLWVLSPLWGSQRDRGGSNDRPGADAPGYSLSPLGAFRIASSPPLPLFDPTTCCPPGRARRWATASRPRSARNGLPADNSGG